MQARKRIMQTALAIAIGGVLIAPAQIWSMDAEDAPESVTIDSLVNLYTGVEFDHAMHVDYASCQECHHHTTGGEVVNPNCARCHSTSGEADEVTCTGCHATDRFNETYIRTLEAPELYHIDKPGLKGAYHLNCISCHETTSGPTGCQDCHTMTDAGEKMFYTGKYSPAKGHSAPGH